MSAAEIAAILSAIGAGALLKEAIVWLFRWITGRAGARRTEVDRMATERNRSRRRERVLDDHIQHLRGLLYRAPCVDIDDIPPYPTEENNTP